MNIFTRMLGFGQKRSSNDLAVPDPNEAPAGSGGDVIYTPPIPTNALGAVEICAALYARTFGAADISPARLTKKQLAQVGRALICQGNAVFAIDGDRLIQSFAWDIQGPDTDPATWIYNLDVVGPSGGTTWNRVPAENVLHFRVGEDWTTPWIGRPALARAAELGRLAGRTERSVGDEAGGAIARLFSFPGEDDEAQRFARLVNSTRGAALAVPPIQGTFDKPSVGTFNERIGPTPPATMIDLYKITVEHVLKACGVPPAYFGGGGAGMRDAHRTFLLGIQGLVNECIVSEIEAKLGPCEISFRTVNPIEVRARAFASMVGALMDPQQAAKLAGLDSDGAVSMQQPSMEMKARAYKQLIKSRMDPMEARKLAGLDK